VRVLIVNTDYMAFLADFYRRVPGLAHEPYDEQQQRIEAQYFGPQEAYARAFRALGHDAVAITANNEPLQLAWARDHGRSVELGRPAWKRRAAALRDRVPPELRRGAADPATLLGIVVEQSAFFEPDVVLVQDLHLFDRDTLVRLKRHARLIVGQHAATRLDESTPLDAYDLVVSSFGPTLEDLQARGVPVVANALAFDTAVAAALPATPPIDWPLTFVGNLQTVHSTRLRFLEELAALVPELHIWTPHELPRRSPLRDRRVGAVYGLDMYAVLQRSFATVNHHGDVAAYANNMRLYEATGVGTLLLTDAKPNLGSLFDLGDEVLAYETAEECAATFVALTAERRDSIAGAGRARTLRDHTYELRARELLEAFAAEKAHV
jgi:hypothetical protein